MHFVFTQPLHFTEVASSLADAALEPSARHPAYVRAAEGDGRVGTHHERRHRVVRVLVTDGEVSLARVSRVWGLPWILAILSSS